MTESTGPVRVLAARLLTYRGRTETYSSLAALFQGLCGLLREAGRLAAVYPVLGRIKQRILQQGAAVTADDVFAVAAAHNAASPDDPAQVSSLRVVVSVPGTGDRLAYHREFVQNLRHPSAPALTLNASALGEVLLLLLQPRLSGRRELADQAGWLKFLDLLYRATFSRTIRKELCGPSLVIPLGARPFHLMVDLKKTAHLSLSWGDLALPLLERLAQSPDLAVVLADDDRLGQRVEEGLRLQMAAVAEAVRAASRPETPAPAAEGPAEVLEEL